MGLKPNDLKLHNVNETVERWKPIVDGPPSIDTKMAEVKKETQSAKVTAERAETLAKEAKQENSNRDKQIIVTLGSAVIALITSIAAIVTTISTVG